jgi:hypothetical protein
MQAVILWTLGTSWPHSRMASPVHICCASEKARLGRAESAVAAKAMAKRSAILLVRWKVIDAFPKIARAVLAAVHWGRCTRFALPHASSITRESPGAVARFLPMFESKVLRRPVANYALTLRSCNGSRQHFLDCCVHATSTEAQMRDNSILTQRILRSRRVSKKKRVRAAASPSSTAVEQPARRTRVQWRVCGVGE